MSKLKQQRGFTLIEILVAMIVLSVGLLGVAGLTVSVIQGNAYSKNVSTATVIAEARLEDMRRAGYANTNTTNFSAGPDSVSMGGSPFSRVTSITNNSTASGMKTITVRVSWGVGAHAVALNTILAQ